jgi:gas vesicle protein GvpA/GvpJ/GvpM family
MNGAALAQARAPAVLGAREVTLLDLLDRLLQGGIAIQGEITLAAADIDLVDLSLRLVVGSVGTLGRGLGGPLPRGGAGA